MITEYHRPETMEAALALLDRPRPVTLPMGGGTVLNRPGPEPVAVVDLQSLGLDGCEQRGNLLLLGARLTLQALLNLPTALLPAALREAIQHEAGYNLRQAATLAGSLVACDGRSALATALLALDAGLHITRYHQKQQTIGLGEFLPMRSESLKGGLITQVTLPAKVKLSYQYVARTPADLPIVCVAVAAWPSGRTRIALGGWGKVPLLALDGPDASGGPEAAESAYSQAEDAWASAAYRRHTAAVLAQRGLIELG